MKIDKAKLQKLQGLIPCTSSITFTPSVYSAFEVKEAKKVKEEEEGYKEYLEYLEYLEIKKLLPEFTCNALTIGQGEKVKNYGVYRVKCAEEEKSFPDKKEKMLEIIEGNITGWNNLYDMSTGEILKFSSELVNDLPENVIESILMDLARYAGIVQRGI
jgi:hypothetical protein